MGPSSPLSFLLLLIILLLPFHGSLSSSSKEEEEVGGGSSASSSLLKVIDSIYMLTPCNRSREILTGGGRGRISDGPRNYTQDTTCEWIIKAPPGYWISLKIDRVRTECSYDYLFVLDGASYRTGRLLASFSGASDPQVTLLAKSGHMLITLYSDPNYVLEGFQAEYEVSPCPFNCSGVGECQKKEEAEEGGLAYFCNCGEGWNGIACQTRVGGGEEISESHHINLVKDEDNSTSTTLSRVGHSSILFDNGILYIFGGFDLDNILDSLVKVNVTSNVVEEMKRKNENVSWPKGRFGHAFCPFQDGFFIHGGKMEDKRISGELFFFNKSKEEWEEIKGNFPSLMYHSMTLTPSGWIYIYGGTGGGGEEEEQFYPVLWRFNGTNPSTSWEIVSSSCCGKEGGRAVLGHSMTYWDDKNAFILFGGLGASDYGRFSKLSSQLWLFLLNSSTWVNLDYRRNYGGVPSGLYPERAFHTAHILRSGGSHYLIVYGGYTHVHNKDESCYSSQTLVYNLECHIFLPPEQHQGNLRNGDGNIKPSSGLFGHSSVLIKDQLIIVGGYRGYLTQSPLKRVPLLSLSSPDCSGFDKWRCSGDPKCGWCPTSGKCFDKIKGAPNCTTNLQTVQCPGICPLLSSCQSCASLQGGACVWCGSSEQCWSRKDPLTEPLCNNNPLDTSSQLTEAQCAKRNWRLGATQYEYRYPPDLDNPDSVKIVNSSVLIVPKEYFGVGASTSSEPVTYALRGSLVGLTISHPMKKLELCALQAEANLTLSSSSEERFTTSYRWTDYQLCYNLSWPGTGGPVYLQPSHKIKFDLMARTLKDQEKPGRVTIQLRWNGAGSSTSRILRRDHLVPYEGEGEGTNTHLHHHCLSYKHCQPCVGDSACLWRKEEKGKVRGGGACIPRMIRVPWEEEEEISEAQEKEVIPNPILSSLNRSSLIIQPEDCPACTDFSSSSCEKCLDPGVSELQCEWWEEEMSCQRRGRRKGKEGVIVSKEKCPAPCSIRGNCSSCVEGGRCVWCERMQECFVFSLYTSVYQYGQCYQWIDKREGCTRCDRQSTCEACVLNMGCGWNYNENGGFCSEGDFEGPYSNKTVVVEGDTDSGLDTFSNRTWTYGDCPDVNECELGIDNCHPNATCVNTPGSFTCYCRQGFTGDGKKNCDRTCLEPCIHGSCSSSFVCECDLGWTGSACSIDCGCHNHSYCENNGALQGCDECKDHTTGDRCELCSEGSYGNATLPHVGCTPCNCNGHGDEEAGLCDPSTGHCFCLNNTTGRDCSECAAGFYGDPSEGRPCYHGCGGRVVIKGRKEGYFGVPGDFIGGIGLGGFRKRLGIGSLGMGMSLSSSQRNASSTEHCMWVIRGGEDPSSSEEESSSSSSSSSPAGLLITVEPTGFDIPCTHNVLLVYQGFSEFEFDLEAGSTKTRLVAAICNEQGSEHHHPDPHHRRRVGGGPSSLLLSSKRKPINVLIQGGGVATLILKYARMGNTRFSFNGNFKVLGTQEEVEEHKKPVKNSSPSQSPFNISTIYEGTSASSVLSRYGHSLHVDSSNLWVFGGRSLSHGPLNDIRHFSRDSNSWVPLTITVFQSEEAVPSPRYFHAGVITSDNVILIHGGISGNLTFLEDSWKFDTRNSRWSKVCEGPKLAGHTITLRTEPGSSSFSLLMIGGFNPENGFSDKIYSLTGSECWTEVWTSGTSPLGIYGHSTVHYKETDTFYVFGGTLHGDPNPTVGQHSSLLSPSSRMFVLHWPTKKWSMLTPMEEHQLGPYPGGRFLHTSVAMEDYMVIIGGIGNNGGSSSSSPSSSPALVYVYRCNLWLQIEVETSNLIASSSGSFNASLFLMGGWTPGHGSTSESIIRLHTPVDACALHHTKSRCKSTIGCAFCSSNNNQSQRCYNAEKDMPNSCSTGASNIEFWKGVSCTSSRVAQETCGRFTSCSECLAVYTWPEVDIQSASPNMTQRCQWCTNGKEGRCIQLHEDSSCGQKQWVITNSTQCLERVCSAPQCERCTSDAKCIWTRQILRSRERSWELRLQPVYDWNCVRKSILDTTSSVSVISSPPASCPVPCWHFDSCEECLEAPGSEGGFHQCYWSVSQGRCVSPAYSPLLCFGGVCGPILRGSPSLCPKSCASLKSCTQCLENPSCGWCAVSGHNGDGACLPPTSPNFQCPSTNSSWHYLTCPRENECTNGHHQCDPKSEQCIDLEQGYRCQCRPGYERSDTSCIPLCPEGCVHGRCVEPGRCECNFGYVGTNCSVQCDCNGHSMCLSVEKLDVCLECKNNTMGPKCSQCKPLFVGDPRNNGACISCLDYCNGHSEICLGQVDFNQYCNPNSLGSYLSPIALKAKILSSPEGVGPSTTAFCCHCANQTAGDTCNDCIPGYFRGYDDKRLPCRKCMCHGHGTICDPVTGHDCDCHNNTESEHCTQNTLKQNLHHQCWKHQCSKCRDSFLGTPTNGHQCYLQMQMEEFYCFDPKSPEQSCGLKPKPLLSGRTVFFAVQPKFMNVNIRITLDVTHGATNVYLSPKDDAFIIRQDEYRWIHRVEFDMKYGLMGDREKDHMAFRVGGMGEMGSGSTTTSPPIIEFGEFTNSTDDLNSLNRIIPKTTANPSSSSYRFIEQEAAGYATYVTVQDPKAVLLVRNLRNRVVITLPQDSHDLRLTRFYLVLEGIGDVSFGSIVFRQDQLHIDLFVFFSVFFSAFFLFLAGCGIAWKVKQNMEARRARHRHVAEMLSMAKRPFAVCTLLLQPDQSTGIADAYKQCRKSCRKGCICTRPLAVEVTSASSSVGVCTMLISMPGGSNVPIKLCVGSVLANLQRSSHHHHHNFGSSSSTSYHPVRRRRFQ